MRGFCLLTPSTLSQTEPFSAAAVATAASQALLFCGPCCSFPASSTQPSSCCTRACVLSKKRRLASNAATPVTFPLNQLFKSCSRRYQLQHSLRHLVPSPGASEPRRGKERDGERSRRPDRRPDEAEGLCVVSYRGSVSGLGLFFSFLNMRGHCSGVRMQDGRLIQALKGGKKS